MVIVLSIWTTRGCEKKLGRKTEATLPLSPSTPQGLPCYFLLFWG